MVFEWRQPTKEDINLFNDWHSTLIKQSLNLDPITKFITSKDVLLGETIEAFDPSTILVAVYENSAVGVVMFSIKNSKISKQKILEIEAIAVNPSLANRGIGTKIIKELSHNTEILCGQKINLISALIEDSNISSKKLFLKNNFIESQSQSRISWKKYNTYRLDVSHLKNQDKEL